jgi:hypothetical protein
MEEPTAPPPSGAPNPAAPAPVMDVVPPRPKAEPAVGTSPEPMAIAPPEEVDPKAKPAAQPTDQKAAPKPPKPPKQPGNGVTVAIVATVIIVFGLALLAVYAYLKQNK